MIEIRICLVGDGSSIHLIRWARWLRSKGHIVQMVSLTKDNDSSKEYDEYRYVPPKSGLFAYARRSFPIAKVVREFQPDVIHGHYLTGGGFYSVVSSTKIPVVVSAWGSDLYFDSKNFLKRQCIKYAINHSAIVMGDSNHILNEVGHLSAKAQTRKVIFGIDTGLFKPSPIKHDKFRFLSLRATAWPYNPMTIVQAFEQANLDAELLMQRPGVTSFEVMDYVKANPELDKRVIWLDKRPYDKMPELYNSCDVGISIPAWDSSSTAMMEAMSCGLPVIASDIPMNREWIVPCYRFMNRLDVNGFITGLEENTKVLMDAREQLASHMDDMITLYRDVMPGAMNLIKQNARQMIVENASFDKEMLKAESIYKEVLNGKE